MDAGQLLAEVGVAPTLPAEFVVFRVGRTQDALEVTGRPASALLAVAMLRSASRARSETDQPRSTRARFILSGGRR